MLAPALVKLGVTPMAAHMFVMYNGMLSMITPPVAFAAYAAANIARTDGWTTGWIACLVGWSTFILPFLFVLTPSLLMDGPAYLIVWNFVRILFGLFVGTAGIVGFALTPLSLPMRVALRRAGAADRAAAGVVRGRVLRQFRRHRGRDRAARGRLICAARPPPRRRRRRRARRAIAVGESARAISTSTLRSCAQCVRVSSRQIPSASCEGRSEIENSTDSFAALCE